MPNIRNNIPFIRRSFSRRQCIRLGQLPHFIHFRSIFKMSTAMDKDAHNMLDYEPEEDTKDTTSGAEEAELRFNDLNLEEGEVPSMDGRATANPETPCTEGACALPATPKPTQEKEDLDPQLSELVSQLVRSQVGQALEISEARLRAAESEIQGLKEEQQKDQAKLSSYEAKEARKKEKRKERKARNKNPEQVPIPEKRPRTSMTSSTTGPSQEELNREEEDRVNNLLSKVAR